MPSECGCETYLAEGLGSALGCQLPSRITVCCKMLPALNRDVTGAQGVLDGVFVAQCLTPLPASAAATEPVQNRSVLEDDDDEVMLNVLRCQLTY